MKISVIIAGVRFPYTSVVMESLKDADEILFAYSKDQYVATVNRTVKATTGDLIIQTADRFVYRPDWREKVEEATGKLKDGTGVISFAPNICLASAITRDYLENDLRGNYFYPDYWHYNCDQELGDFARLRNKYTEVLGLFSILPKLEKENISEDCIQHDGDIWRDRSNRGYPYEN
jgi:hypothetical protein